MTTTTLTRAEAWQLERDSLEHNIEFLSEIASDVEVVSADDRAYLADLNKEIEEAEAALRRLPPVFWRDYSDCWVYRSGCTLVD